jgi:putative transport protein
MEHISAIFRTRPELAIFLTLAGGYWLGRLRLGSFTVGTVTGVLLVGLLVGQMNIAISPNVKAVFFLMFLFAVGYKAGPQFANGLRKEGLPQAAFAIIACVVGLGAVLAVARVLGFDAGQGAGLLAGSLTNSAWRATRSRASICLRPRKER